MGQCRVAAPPWLCSDYWSHWIERGRHRGHCVAPLMGFQCQARSFNDSLHLFPRPYLIFRQVVSMSLGAIEGLDDTFCLYMFVNDVVVPVCCQCLCPMYIKLTCPRTSAMGRIALNRLCVGSGLMAPIQVIHRSIRCADRRHDGEQHCDDTEVPQYTLMHTR